MLARIRKAMEEKDRGFTLIELLVVMIIIGILAAIAIPVFLNQRKKAVDSSIKSDLRTVANEMETFYTDSQVYPATATSTGATTNNTLLVGTTTVHLSSANVVTFKLYDDAGMGTVSATPATAVAYCIQGYNAKATANAAASAFLYESAAGGLQSSKGSCP